MIVEPGRAGVLRRQNSAGIPLKCGDGSQDPSQTPFPQQRYRITCPGHGAGAGPAGSCAGGPAPTRRTSRMRRGSRKRSLNSPASGGSPRERRAGANPTDRQHRVRISLRPGQLRQRHPAASGSVPPAWTRFWTRRKAVGSSLPREGQRRIGGWYGRNGAGMSLCSSGRGGPAVPGPDRPQLEQCVGMTPWITKIPCDHQLVITGDLLLVPRTRGGLCAGPGPQGRPGRRRGAGSGRGAVGSLCGACPGAISGWRRGRSRRGPV